MKAKTIDYRACLVTSWLNEWSEKGGRVWWLLHFDQLEMGRPDSELRKHTDRY